jgi:hypothetical protein
MRARHSAVAPVLEPPDNLWILGAVAVEDEDCPKSMWTFTVRFFAAA